MLGAHRMLGAYGCSEHTDARSISLAEAGWYPPPPLSAASASVAVVGTEHSPPSSLRRIETLFPSRLTGNVG
jgi:hypothetical protein